MKEQSPNADAFVKRLEELADEVLSAEEVERQYGPPSMARNLHIVQERRRKASRVKSNRGKAR